MLNFLANTHIEPLIFFSNLPSADCSSVMPQCRLTSVMATKPSAQSFRSYGKAFFTNNSRSVNMSRNVEETKTRISRLLFIVGPDDDSFRCKNTR